MTHRPIQAIEINGFEPGGTPRALPIFEWVDPATLLVDEGYQRDSSERSMKLVRKIVAGFDWARFKAPVAVLTDAGLELIDGQHTAIAAASHPDVDKIPVMIIEAPERADRAGAFIAHNRDRVTVTATQLHVAAIAAGDAEAQAVQRVCAEAGVEVLRAQSGAGKYKPGTTVAVAAIGALIRGRGEVVTVRILSVLARAGCAPINSVQIKAADLLLNTEEYSTQITAESLVASIQAMAMKIDSEAAVFRAAHPSTPVWKAMGILWFKNRRAARVVGTGSESAATNLKTPDKAGESTPKPPGPNRPHSTWSDPGPRSARRPAPPTSPNGDLKTASGKLLENFDKRPVNPVPVKHQAPAADKRDTRTKLDGWIPGVFQRFCADCEETYIGDKRSMKCADCAYGAKEVARAS